MNQMTFKTDDHIVGRFEHVVSQFYHWVSCVCLVRDASIFSHISKHKCINDRAHRSVLTCFGNDAPRFFESVCLLFELMNSNQYW